VDGLLSQGYHHHLVPGCVERSSVVVYMLIRPALSVGYTWAHNFAAGMDTAACRRMLMRNVYEKRLCVHARIASKPC
jgi:hypothetical protein